MAGAQGGGRAVSGPWSMLRAGAEAGGREMES